MPGSGKMINAFLGDVLGQGWANLLNRGPRWIIRPPVSDYQLAGSLPGKEPVYSRYAFCLSVKDISSTCF